jgi:hypothetical protein
VDQFPDILYVLNPNYVTGKESFGSAISSVPSFQISRKSGLHLMNGIFMSHGPNIEPGHVNGAKIIDIAPTILYDNGLPIPRSMDGSVLKTIFNKRFLERHSIEQFDLQADDQSVDFTLSREERKEIEEKLKSLGYI